MNGQNDIELTPELKKLAEDAAKITNVSSEEAFEYIVEAITRDAEWRTKAHEHFERIASMNFEKICQDFADAIGVDNLSDHQKTSALMHHILNEKH